VLSLLLRPAGALLLLGPGRAAGPAASEEAVDAILTAAAGTCACKMGSTGMVVPELRADLLWGWATEERRLSPEGSAGRAAVLLASLGLVDLLRGFAAGPAAVAAVVAAAAVRLLSAALCKDTALLRAGTEAALLLLEALPAALLGAADAAGRTAAAEVPLLGNLEFGRDTLPLLLRCCCAWSSWADAASLCALVLAVLSLPAPTVDVRDARCAGRFAAAAACCSLMLSSTGLEVSTAVLLLLCILRAAASASTVLACCWC
jgi:hypothetical protein